MALARNPLEAFIWGAGGAALTPDEIARRREMEQALVAKTGIDTSPVGHWTQGIARVLGTAGGAYRRNKLDAAQGENNDYNQTILQSLLGGAGAGAAASEASAIPMTETAGELAATAPASVDISGDKQTFIQSLLPAAIEESKRTGVDPRIIVAQAAQETGWGKSAPGNNFFGIKSHGQDGGNSLMTTEYVDGKPVAVRDSFRAYGSPGESVRGYGDFILQNPRYEPFRTAQGLDAQLEALQASGYATDPNYSNSVGAIARSIQLPTEVAAATPEAAIDAVSPAGGSLTDEVAEFEQTPAYAAQFPNIDAQGGLRPFKAGESRPNSDGSYSTELTTTWQLPDGSWVNVPSLWMGDNGPVEFSPDDEQSILGAMQKYEALNGQTFKRFSDERSAVAAAEGRSQHGGAGAGPQLDGGNSAIAQALASGQRQNTTGINPAILRALADPRANAQTRGIAEILLRQQMEQNDPLRRLQIQQAERELNTPAKRGTTTINGRLVDDQTGQVIAEFPDQVKPTSDQQNYEYYRDFETRNGRQPLGPLEWEQAQRKAGATMITNNAGGNRSKFGEESDKAAAQRLGTIVEDGMKAGGIMADMQQLGDLAGQIQTGRGAEALVTFGPYLQALGIDVEGLEPAQAYRSIIDRLAPNMRPAGAGATSDFDARQFLSSLPALGNEAGANEVINQTFQAISQNKIDAAAIARKAQREEITWQDAEDQIAKLPNPYQRFKEWEKNKKAEGKPPEGVDPADWEFMTPEERRLFQ